MLLSSFTHAAVGLDSIPRSIKAPEPCGQPKQSFYTQLQQWRRCPPHSCVPLCQAMRAQTDKGASPPHCVCVCLCVSRTVYHTPKTLPKSGRPRERREGDWRGMYLLSFPVPCALTRVFKGGHIMENEDSLAILKWTSSIYYVDVY